MESRLNSATLILSLSAERLNILTVQRSLNRAVEDPTFEQLRRRLKISGERSLSKFKLFSAQPGRG